MCAPRELLFYPHFLHVDSFDFSSELLSLRQYDRDRLLSKVTDPMPPISSLHAGNASFR